MKNQGVSAKTKQDSLGNLGELRMHLFSKRTLFFFFFRERLVSLARSRDRTALPGIGSRNNFARNGRCCQRRRDNSSRGEDGGVPRSFRSIVNYS